MPDASTIETINREQLATATDRLLLGRGRVATRRRSTPVAPHARGSIPSIAHAAHVRGSTAATASAPHGRDSIPSIARAPVVRGSHPHILHRPLACGSQLIAPPAPASPPARPVQAFDARQLGQERTVPARRGALHAQMFAIPALAGVVIGLAALL